MSRLLKGWQEEASDTGTEKRSWRWLIEADVDANGFDFKGEKTAFWAFCRLSIDRTGPGDGDGEKFEDIDLEGFGVLVLRERPEKEVDRKRQAVPRILVAQEDQRG